MLKQNTQGVIALFFFSLSGCRLSESEKATHKERKQKTNTERYISVTREKGGFYSSGNYKKKSLPYQKKSSLSKGLLKLKIQRAQKKRDSTSKKSTSFAHQIFASGEFVSSSFFLFV
jgi:hypothetical protein